MIATLSPIEHIHRKRRVSDHHEFCEQPLDPGALSAGLVAALAEFPWVSSRLCAVDETRGLTSEAELVRLERASELAPVATTEGEAVARFALSDVSDSSF